MDGKFSIERDHPAARPLLRLVPRSDPQGLMGSIMDPTGTWSIESAVVPPTDPSQVSEARLRWTLANPAGPVSKGATLVKADWLSAGGLRLLIAEAGLPEPAKNASREALLALVEPLFQA